MWYDKLKEKYKDFHEEYEGEYKFFARYAMYCAGVMTAFSIGKKIANTETGIALLELAAKNEAKKVTIRNGDTYEIACKYVTKVIEEQ